MLNILTLNARCHFSYMNEFSTFAYYYKNVYLCPTITINNNNYLIINLRRL